MSHPGLLARRLRRALSALVSLGVTSLSGLASAEALSAEAAVGRAAEQNPSLRAALLDADAARHAVRAERGARSPSFVASVQGEHSETISRPGLSGVAGPDGAASRAVRNSVETNAAVRYTADIGTELEVGTRAGTSYNRTTWSGPSPPPDLEAARASLAVTPRPGPRRARPCGALRA